MNFWRTKIKCCPLCFIDHFTDRSYFENFLGVGQARLLRSAYHLISVVRVPALPPGISLGRGLASPPRTDLIKVNRVESVEHLNFKRETSLYQRHYIYISLSKI